MIAPVVFPMPDGINAPSCGPSRAVAENEVRRHGVTGMTFAVERTQEVIVEGGARLPFVSVIVATRGRPSSLIDCLRSVLACDYPDFEVVVVDQTGGNSVEKLSEEIRDPRLFVQADAGVGKSRGENIAIATARGDVLVFTDDDCTVPRTWLRRAVHVLAQEPTVGLIFGAVRGAPHDPVKEFIPAFLPKRYTRIDGGTVTVHPGAMGANLTVAPRRLRCSPTRVRDATRSWQSVSQRRRLGACLSRAACRLRGVARSRQ